MASTTELVRIGHDALGVVASFVRRLVALAGTGRAVRQAAVGELVRRNVFFATDNRDDSLADELFLPKSVWVLAGEAQAFRLVLCRGARAAVHDDGGGDGTIRAPSRDRGALILADGTAAELPRGCRWSVPGTWHLLEGHARRLWLATEAVPDPLPRGMVRVNPPFQQAAFKHKHRGQVHGSAEGSLCVDLVVGPRGAGARLETRPCPSTIAATSSQVTVAPYRPGLACPGLCVSVDSAAEALVVTTDAGVFLHSFPFEPEWALPGPRLCQFCRGCVVALQSGMDFVVVIGATARGGAARFRRTLPGGAVVAANAGGRGVFDGICFGFVVDVPGTATGTFARATCLWDPASLPDDRRVGVAAGGDRAFPVGLCFSAPYLLAPGERQRER